MAHGNDEIDTGEATGTRNDAAGTATRPDGDRTGDSGDGGDDLPDLPPEVREAVPDWDDEYFDRVADRLMHAYDLEKDVHVDPTAGGGGPRGHEDRFAMRGELRVESSKHMFHPSVQYANHHMREFLYADRRASVSVADLEELVELGHELADQRVEPNDEHRATEFTFVLVVPEIPADVRSFVDGFKERTLLRFGFHGHYEIHCCVVAPDREEIVASDRTEIDGAFALWEDLEDGDDGLLARVRGLVSL
ncbi:hypothetical protein CHINAEXTREME_08560 [Halobiforma lacisalsi AJ5]|uniref:DUF8052 domain-containing protein n=1 Tax=Natronobacterium lacisalsi AJ5 TaxID=358396 RepID=M0LYJ8_NATLA|nr:hypothetical protein [Halobiforma lacisalsi]APW97827.1 hypothetical protein CHINAEXTREME_08560 [Halobiforma lacisalsi AJ5]EMA37424.1 hypothetical protein C445_01006 [Halobiforma lacisalsi AJ5]